MSFKKVTRPDSPDPVGALLQMLPGNDEAEMIVWLQQHGATNVERLAPGFLSVTASAATMREAEAMARVEIKRPKAMRSS